MIGILLAAGFGRRFDPGGNRNKLMQPLANGVSVAAQAARNLLEVLPVLAVVRPEADTLTAQLEAIGCRTEPCANAADGLSASLMQGIRGTIDADGWLIALGDMPYVKPATIAALVAAIEGGADIAVPVEGGARGNPVAFGRSHLAELLQLDGDRGARALFGRHPVIEVEVDDPGIHRDIDIPADLS